MLWVDLAGVGFDYKSDASDSSSTGALYIRNYQLSLGTGCPRWSRAGYITFYPWWVPLSKLAWAARHRHTLTRALNCGSETLLYMLVTLAYAAGYIPLLPIHTTFVTPLGFKISQPPQSRPSSFALDGLEQLGYLLPLACMRHESASCE
jgi:hypothetical protein